MKPIKKFLIKLTIFVLILILPFVTVFLMVEKSDNQYKNTYLGEFGYKYESLCNTNDKKIIFVGGSSLPFGLRSDLIEQEIQGYKVINFGLYATLGTKFMMDMSKANINPGDIVILSPELNSQTYSLYFNPEAVLQACDGFTWKYKLLSFGENLQLFYNYLDFARSKIEYVVNNNTPDPIGIYRRDSFNEYGDIWVERESNIMNSGVDDTMKITTTDELLDENFINYVNDYCAWVRKRNAKIYFNFSPCNELAIGSSEKVRNNFEERLSLLLNCDLLTSLEECIIDYRYFYDTNFHLNSAGSILYTATLIKKLKIKLGISVENSDSGDNVPPLEDVEIPAPPPVKDDPVIIPDDKDDLTPFDEYNGEPNIDYVDCFNYRLVGSSYQIISVKEDFKDSENFILPSTYNGRNVTSIGENAFYGCIFLKNIYIGLTYKSLAARSFNGCISLEGIYLFAMDGNLISVDSSGLLEGTSKQIKIFIPEGANYKNGYIWVNYFNYFVFFSRGDK